MERGEINLKEFLKIKQKNGENLWTSHIIKCLCDISNFMSDLSSIGVYMGDIKGENVLIKVILLFIFRKKKQVMVDLQFD